MIIPKHWHSPKYLLNGDGSGNITCPWFSCQGAKFLSMNVWWTAFSATAGTLALQGSNDYVEAVDPNTTAPNTNSIITLTVAAPANGQTTGLFGSQPAAGAAGGVAINFENPMALMRLVYTRSAGGTTSQFQAAYFLRAT